MSMSYSVPRIINRIGLHRGFRHALFVGAGANFLIKIFWKLIGLLNTVLLARWLGPEGLGTYFFALTLVGVVATFGVGSVRWFVVQKVASYAGLKEWSLARGLQRRVREFGLISALTLATCLGLAAWYFVEPGGDQLRVTLIVAAILVPVNSQAFLNAGVLEGFGHVVVSQFPEFVIKPLVFLTSLLVVYFLLNIELSATVAISAQVLAAIISLTVTVWLLWPRIPSTVKESSPDYDTGEWVRAGLPFLTIGILGQILWFGDTLLLGMIAGTEAVGIYRPASAIAMLIMFGTDAVIMTIRPTLAKRYAMGETAAFQRISAHAAWAGFGIAVLGTVMALFLGDLMLLVFGPRFEEGATALLILCVGRVIFTALGLPSVFLEMTGRQTILLRGMVVGVSTNVLLNLALIPHFGVNGAAASTAVSLVVLQTHNMIVVRRQLSLDTSIFGLRLRDTIPTMK